MTTHPVDTVVTIPCAGCGDPISLTWTKSAEGWPLYHGKCWEATQ